MYVRTYMYTYIYIAIRISQLYFSLENIFERFISLHNKHYEKRSMEHFFVYLSQCNFLSVK